MTCIRPDWMDLYLEGGLAEAERRELEDHFGRCPDCRRALKERRLFERAASSLPAIEIPPGFAQAILDRLPPSRAAAFGWLASGVTGFLALLTALLGYYLSTGESLLDILDAMGRSVLTFVGLAVPLFAKVLSVGRVFVRLAGDLGTALARGLTALSFPLGPQFLAAGLFLGIVLSALAVLGLKKILSPGEKP
jgi:anti-sigma factor RsiW